MVTKMGPGKYVRAVEFCMGCDWVNFAALDGWAENAVKESLGERAQRIAVAIETEPFAFVQRSDEELTFEEVVFQALGASSMCWINPDTGQRSTGELIFDSSRAKLIGERFMAELRRHAEIERKQAIHGVWSAMGDLIAMVLNSNSGTPMKDLANLVRERFEDSK